MSAEQPRRWEEELLVQVGREASWPATPDLRSRVMARVGARAGAVLGRPPSPTLPRKRGAGFPALPRSVALAAVALLVAAVLVVLAVPRTRTAVADFFGLVDGYRVEVVTPRATPTGVGAVSSATPVATYTPAPTPTATLLRDVAKRVTLEEATRRIGFEPALVPGFGEPEVYVLDTGYGYGTSEVATVVLRYPMFDLWEARTGGREFLSKGVPSGSVIETTTVHGEAAYWVGGFSRILRWVDEAGAEVPGTARVVTQYALLWNMPDRGFYRIETDLPLDDALRIAESLP